MARAQKRHRTKSEWSKLMRSYEEGNLSQAEFCEEHKIGKNYFYKRLSEYRKKQRSIESIYEREFVPLTVVGEKSSIEEGEDIGSVVEVELSNGIKIKFSKGCKASELKSAVHVLGCYAV